MDTPPISFGQWLKRQRRARDWTQEELASRLGCAPVSLRKIESGERRPSKEIAQRIADVFSVPEEHRASFIAFARDNGTIYHTYTVSAPDPFVAPYNASLLRRTPKAPTNEFLAWRKDEYPD